MLRKTIRAFGLLFGGTVCFVGGGCIAIYGIIIIYSAPPGGRSPGEVLQPLNDILLSVLTSEVTVAVAALGTAGFVWEVRENGLLEADDRLRAERVKEMRRELAEEREAWDPPEEDREEPSIYERLRAESTGGLVLIAHEMVSADPPTVRGVVGNTANTEREDIRVRVRFEDDGGEEVGTGLATRRELQPDDRWEFEIFQRENAERVESYGISPPQCADTD